MYEMTGPLPGQLNDGINRRHWPYGGRWPGSRYSPALVGAILFQAGQDLTRRQIHAYIIEHFPNESPADLDTISSIAHYYHVTIRAQPITINPELRRTIITLLRLGLGPKRILHHLEYEGVYATLATIQSVDRRYYGIRDRRPKLTYTQRLVFARILKGQSREIILHELELRGGSFYTLVQSVLRKLPIGDDGREPELQILDWIKVNLWIMEPEVDDGHSKWGQRA